MGRFLVRFGVALVCTITGLQLTFDGLTASQYPIRHGLISIVIGVVFLIGAAAILRSLLFGPIRSRRIYHYHIFRRRF